MPQKEKVQM